MPRTSSTKFVPRAPTLVRCFSWGTSLPGERRLDSSPETPTSTFHPAPASASTSTPTTGPLLSLGTGQWTGCCRRTCCDEGSEGRGDFRERSPWTLRLVLQGERGQHRQRAQVWTTGVV